MTFHKIIVFLVIWGLVLGPLPVVSQEANPPSDQDIEHIGGESVDSEKVLAEVRDQIEGRRSDSALDVFGLLSQNVYGFKNPELIDRGALTFVDDNFRQVTNSRSGQIYNGSSVGFTIEFQGRSLNTIKSKITSLAVIGPYIAFTDGETSNLFFIDLNFAGQSLARTALPIFRIPLETQSVLQKIERAGQDALSVNGITISKDVFNVFSEIQQVSFNITANLVDPASQEQSQQLADHFQEYFSKALELRSQQLGSELENIGGAEKVFNRLSSILDPKKRVEEFSRDQLLEKTVGSVSENFKVQRKLVSRIKNFWAQLTLPRPLAAPEIAQALSLVAYGATERGAPPGTLREGLLQLAHHRGVQMGAAVVTGAALAAIFPHQVGQFLYASLDLTRTVAELAFGKVHNLGVLGYHALQGTLSGFNPITFKNAYLNRASLYKLRWGLGAIFTTLYLTLGVAHISANSVSLVKEIAAVDFRSLAEKEGSWYAAFRSFLINRENRLERELLANLAAGDAKNQSQSQLTFTEADDNEVSMLIEDIKEKQKGPLSKWLDSIRGSQRAKEADLKKPGEIASMAGAIRHFLFSTASLTNSARLFTVIWSQWAKIRYMAWTPVQSAMAILYPKLYDVESEGHYASEFNGANRFIAKDLHLRFFDRQRFGQILEYEDKMIDVEAEIYKTSTKATFKALIRFLSDNRDLQKIFQEGGIKSLSDPRFDRLSGEQKRFFRSYFTQLNERATIAFVKALGPTHGVQFDNTGGVADIKEQSLVLSPYITLTPSEAENYVNQSVDESLYSKAVEQSKFAVSGSAVAENLKTKLMHSLNPDNNAAVRRNAVVKKQLKNPQAVARAVRSLIASNLVDKPMSLFFAFVCLAGITQGIFKPLQDDMFGPNSWFYLSRMVFASGFVYDVITGVLADTWLKLQQDEFHEGKFNDVPQGEDAKKSYLSWYIKKTFRNRENSIWANHLNNIKLIWGNMKPAFTMTLVMGLMTLGRLDVDTYLTGYLMSYCVPLSSFYMMLEQGFELSASYFYKDIPERLRSHPLVQRYVNGEIGKRRLWFNFYEKVYKNVIGYTIGNFFQMTTAEFGSRSFSRIMLGGYTPTELVIKGLEATKNHLGFVPGVTPLVNLCERLLATRYTDFKKVPRPQNLSNK